VTAGHGGGAPSPWVVRWVAEIPAGGEVLDLACGAGRHAMFLAGRGYAVTAVDRDAALLAVLERTPGVATVVADLEGAPWPLPGRRFAGIVVTNYLHRPLFPVLLDAIAAGGVLIYETFAAGNERYGRPSNPDFLLRPGELLEVAHGRMRVLGYEDVFLPAPQPAMVQRICARAL
jgi:SAM-dependent methyltransferase